MTDNSQNASSRSLKRMLLVSLGSGCLTFLVAGLAIMGGVLLDRANGTTPRYILIFLAVSVPFSMAGAYLVAHRAIKRMRAESAGEQVGSEGEGEEEGEHEENDESGVG
jgi:F0F1-type ATP synthase assembly protein I